MAFNSYDPKKGDIVFYKTSNPFYGDDSIPGTIVEVFPSDCEELFDKVSVKWTDDKAERTELISAAVLGCYLTKIRNLEDILREMKSRVDNLCG
jgi:hypothetical protein